MSVTLIAIFLSSKAVWAWLHRLGGPGLILLGIADASVVPLPGSMDAFTIVLSAHRPGFWWYYAIMATAGTVLGGWMTYRIFEKGEEKTLEKKIGKERADKAYKKFEKHGGALIVFGSVMPPPFPMVPILAVPGVLHYPLKRFLGFLAIGRSIRFFAVAFIGRVFGTKILGFFGKYYQPVLDALIALAIAGGVGALVYFLWYRPRHGKNAEGQHPKEKVA